MNSAWIARQLVRQTFNNKALLICPETFWTGYECDLLVVTNDLRLIDVEVKVSRADFKRDAKKEKWWHRQFAGHGTEQILYDSAGHVVARWRDPVYNETARQWPPKIWKHYFAMPEAIWTPELAAFLPSQKSGVLLLREKGSTHWFCERRATPNRDAQKIGADAVIDIARLAHLRMWDALISLQDAEARLAGTVKEAA